MTTLSVSMSRLLIRIELVDVLREPVVSMQHEGNSVAIINQSSAAKEALLLHRAKSLKTTATNSRIPHAIVTRMTRSPLGLSTISTSTSIAFEKRVEIRLK